MACWKAKRYWKKRKGSAFVRGGGGCGKAPFCDFSYDLPGPRARWGGEQRCEEFEPHPGYPEGYIPGPHRPRRADGTIPGSHRPPMCPSRRRADSPTSGGPHDL